ncbi:MAG: conjugal transfer protein TraW [Gammaproteobacteria bacterium]
MTLCKCLTSLVLMGMSGMLMAESMTIGKTYPVIEKDALAEIEEKAAHTNWQQALKTEPKTWQATQAFYLPNASESIQRTHVPWYTTQFDIKDGMGRVIYPKGFTFNPLVYIRMPQRIVVTSPQNYTIIKDKLLASDLILLTEGSAVELSEQLQRPIFVLDQQLKERLGLRVQPAIITQSGAQFVIDEIGPEVKQHAG